MRGSETTLRFRAQSSPGAQVLEENAFLQLTVPKPLGLRSGQSPVALPPLRKEAACSAPRQPTSSRKDSFPKPELTLCPPYRFLRWYVSMPTLRNRIIPLQNSNIGFALKCLDEKLRG